MYLVYLFLEFPTSRLEMDAVADIFDHDGDGYIDYKEFIMALRDRPVHEYGFITVLLRWSGLLFMNSKFIFYMT